MESDQLSTQRCESGFSVGKRPLPYLSGLLLYIVQALPRLPLIIFDLAPPLRRIRKFEMSPQRGVPVEATVQTTFLSLLNQSFVSPHIPIV